jgi:hypothetical protein
MVNVTVILLRPGARQKPARRFRQWAGLRNPALSRSSLSIRPVTPYDPPCACNLEMNMTYDDMLDLMKATSYYLATALGDLRTRLPGAYAIGFGRIEIGALHGLNPALAARCEAMIARFPAAGPGQENEVRAGIARLGDGELVAIATELLDIEDMAMTTAPGEDPL